MRFSLGWLFIAILFAALCIVALLNANRTWSAIAHSTLVLTLSLAIVAAIYTHARERAFALGMAVVGWIYLGAVMLHPTWNLGDVIRKGVYDLIATTKTETIVDGFGTTTRNVTVPDGSEFDTIMKCLLTGLIGAIGGFVAVWLYSRRDASK